MSWTAKIGWLKPGPVSRSVDQLFEILPDDIDVVISTTNWSLQLTDRDQFDPAAIDRPIETAIRAVRDLQAYDRIDVVAVTGDLLQAAMGPAWNEEMRHAVAEAAGLPTTTAMTAAIDALRAVGGHRLAVASPVSDVKNDAVRRYLEAEGFVVAGMVGLSRSSGKAIRELPADAPYRAALDAFRAAPDADAIYLPSLTWGASRHAERLETELDRPVVTLYGSLVWWALNAIGYPTPVSGFGRLLRMVGGGAARA